MSIRENPFFILNLSCKAGRREIAEAVDELSFMMDADKASEAQSVLINPNKRLSAELEWFIGADRAMLDMIRTCIESNTAISTEGLSSISKLNATLYNFSLLDNDVFELGYSIIEIDELFSDIDAEEVATVLSSERQAAKLSAPSAQEVATELTRKRDAIRQAIGEKLSTLSDTDYLDLVSTLAEKCVADSDFADGIILADVIDQYEIRMHSQLESQMDSIKEHIERIKKVPESYISEEITKLMTKVKNWMTVAAPLQMKAQASGMPHNMSEELAGNLRGLSLYLHNEKGRTSDALQLTESLKKAFSGVEAFADKFGEDTDVLKKQLVEKKEEAKAQAAIAELESIKKLSDQLKESPFSYDVTTFINKIKQANSQLKALNVDAESKKKIRETLGYIGRGTAIELHNTKHQTQYALNITKALLEEFSDIPELKAKLLVDQNTLQQQLLHSMVSPSTSTRSTSSSGNPGCLVVIAVIVLIAIVVGFINNETKKAPTATAKPKTTYSATTTAKPKSTTATTTTSATKYSSSSTVGSKVYVDIVSIFPEIGIYTEKSTTYHHFVCRCKTSTGSTVWVYMSTSEYKANFDSSASTSIYNEYASEKTFSSKRITGTVKRADSIMTGLSSDTGATVVQFSSVK